MNTADLQKLFQVGSRENVTLTQSSALCSSWVSCPPGFHPLLFSAVSLLLAPRHLSPSINVSQNIQFVHFTRG